MSRLVIVLCVIVGIGLAAYGQSDDPAAEFGFKPYGSFKGGNIDSINLLNESLNVRIPLASYPQRGNQMPLSFSIVYITPTLEYQLDGPTCKSDPRTCNQDWSMTSSGGITGAGVAIAPDDFPGWPLVNSDGGITFTTSDGASHRALSGSAATDGTGYFVTGTRSSGCVIGGVTVYDEIVVITSPSGIRYTYHAPYPGGTVCAGPLVSIEDTNGNELTPNFTTVNGSQVQSSLTDTLGRTIGWPNFWGTSTTTDLTGCTGSLPMSPTAYTWSVPSPNGGTDTYKMCIGIVTINLPNCQNAHGNHTMRCIFEPNGSRVQSIVLPNGTAWTFGYDSWNGNTSSYAYGDLIQITLPTGGTISYAWGAVPVNNVPCQTGPPWWARGVQSRTLNANDGTGPQQFTYTSVVASGSNPNVQTTVQDPLGNQSVYTISDVTNNCTYYETQAQYKQLQNGSQALLKTVATQYNTSGFPPLPSAITTTWLNGRVSQIQKDYDSATYGNVTTLREYDFGNGAPGSLLRQTITVYQYQNSNAYLTNNLIRLIASVTTKDANNQKTQTTFGYDESSPLGSGVTKQHDASPPAGSARGNQTSVHRWLNGSTVATSACNVSISNGYLVTTNSFYDTGVLQQTTDPCGLISTYQYSGTYYGAFPTTVTNALKQSTNHGYDFNTGLLTSTVDPNQQPINEAYDEMNRLTEISYPDGGSTKYCYTDGVANACGLAGASFSVVITKALTTTSNMTSTIQFDGLGREAQRRIISDPDCSTGDITITTYDGLGRIQTVSNPYCNTSDPTYGFTTFTYDALGRKTQVKHPDNTSVSISYAGSATDVTDEGDGTHNVESVSQVDGLGRSVSVCEVTGSPQSGPGGTPTACGQDINKTGFLTTYSYDALGNLLGVNQGSLHSRTFAYDSLSHLLCAADPETASNPATGVTATCPNPDTGTYTVGTTRYSYDADSNVISRQRPSPNQMSQSTTVTTSYRYDVLNRMNQSSYSDGTTPTAAFTYDQSGRITMGPVTYPVSNGIGRLTSECTLSSSGACVTMRAYSYDPLGRTNQVEMCQDEGCSLTPLAFTYYYDLLGDEVNEYFGNGVPGSTEYVSTYNGAGRLTSYTAPTWNDSTHPPNLLTSVHYDPFGHMTSAMLASGLSESWLYDSRERLQKMAAGTNCSNGTCGTSQYSVTMGYAPNSDVTSANDSVNGNWTYTYDDFNRVNNSTCTATCPDGLSTQGFTYAYDRYGNRWNQTVTAGSGPQPRFTFNGANNHIDGYSYDAAGNLLNDGVNSYTYDAENHIITVNGSGGTSYTYNAEGQRVQKSVSGSRTIAYTYNRSGVMEFSSDATGPNTEIYVPGMHLATYMGDLSAQGGTVLYFQHGDWLGTERARTTLSGVACETIQSLPFGDGQAIHAVNGGCTGATDVSPMHFTGKERDSESGLDNFRRRYFGSSLGRFMTPDPLGGKLVDPQTLNRYSYVVNNPLHYTDPTGLYTCKDDNNQCKTKQDIRFEDARKADLARGGDAARAAAAYGDPTKDNHVSVGFSDKLDKKGEGGDTKSTLGADDKGQLYAQSDVTISSKLSGTAFEAAVGHEGSHVADAQDVVSSISQTATSPYFKVGADITRYQSEQRAYAVTDSILKSSNESWHFACGLTDCVLGTGMEMLAQRPGVIDQIMANSPLYRSNGQPLSPANQGGSVVLTVPH